MTAGFADDPALDTDPDEPAWCEPARARIDDLNRDIRYAITAERERIRQLADDVEALYGDWPHQPFASLIGDPA